MPQGASKLNKLNSFGNYRKKVGKFGEDLAKRFLVKEGYKILEKNFRSRYGEVDIIAIDKDTLVFIEVKTRASFKFGRGQEYINKSKIKKILLNSQLFIKLNKNLPRKIRIDVCIIEIQNGKILNFNLIKGV